MFKASKKRFIEIAAFHAAESRELEGAKRARERECERNVARVAERSILWIVA